MSDTYRWKRYNHAQTPPLRSYASYFGVIKGPGAHGSKEAIDRYIAELRNEW